MKKYQVEVSPVADQDIEDIGAYIFTKNPKAARELVDRIDQRIRAFEEYPFRGPARDDLLSGLRYLIEGEYLIFYIVEAERVRVLRVLHGRRDLRSEL